MTLHIISVRLSCLALFEPDGRYASMAFRPSLLNGGSPPAAEIRNEHIYSPKKVGPLIDLSRFRTITLGGRTAELAHR